MQRLHAGRAEERHVKEAQTKGDEHRRDADKSPDHDLVNVSGSRMTSLSRWICNGLVNLARNRLVIAGFSSLLTLVLCKSIAFANWADCQPRHGSTGAGISQVRSAAAAPSFSAGNHGGSDDVIMTSSKIPALDLRKPVVFVGGCPRSGTTLMRVLLDAHPQVHCGEETRVIPDLLILIRRWRTKGREHERQQVAGVTDEIVDSSARTFIWNVLNRHLVSGSHNHQQHSPVDVLCAKDPLNLAHAQYLSQLFPVGKFLLMIRDGHAVANSIVQRKVRISGVNSSSYEDALRFWQKTTQAMLTQCNRLGPITCHTVRYEDLVVRPVETLRRILDFLRLAWSPEMLRHEQLVSDGSIRVSDMEKSSDQINQPLYQSAVDGWREHFPPDVLQRASELAPLLRQLAYAPPRA